MMRTLIVLVVFSTMVVGLPSAASEPNATTQMIQATFKLVNPTSTATCFLVSRPHPSKPDERETILITAAHVFKQMTGDEATLILRKANKDGTFARHEMHLKVRARNKPLWTKHGVGDIAVLRISLPEGTATVPLPVSALANEWVVKNGRFGPGDDVRIACYPIRFEINAAAFPVVRRGTVASFPLVPIKPHPTFLVDYNNFVGDSGGPVFVAEKDEDEGTSRPLVLGLVLGQHLYDERTKLAFEERVVHHRLGLGIIVHADYVRQTIELLPK